MVDGDLQGEGAFRPAKSPFASIAWAALLLLVGVGMFTAGVVLWSVEGFKAGTRPPRTSRQLVPSLQRSLPPHAKA